MPRAALALGLLYLAACDAWHLSINRNGLVLISVIGRDEPRQRFRIRTRDAAGTVEVLDVPASGQMSISPVRDGTLELTLLMPDRCRVAGSNPRTLSVAAGQEVRLRFDVHCG